MTPNMQQELERLDKEHAEKRLGIEAKYSVLDLLPVIEGYAQPFVHAHKLYGSNGSIHWQVQRYSSIAKGKSPDAALLRTLLAAFPPEPVIKWSDRGTTSFRPEPDAYESNGEATDLDPVIVTVDPGEHANHYDVKWWSKLANGSLWTFEVQFSLHQFPFGRLDIKANRDSFGRGDIVSYERCEIYPIEGCNRTRYAAGDRKYPNHFVMWWERGRGADIPALIEAKAVRP